MPVSNPVIAGDALARGLKNQFDFTWRRRYEAVSERLSGVMDLGIASTLIAELYGYFETAPYIQRREYDEEVPSRAFRARNYEVENFSWDISVFWKMEDRLFDQLKGLERMARQAGENAATLPERVFFQLLTSSADAQLLPAIPNAPDGVALYSAVDGDGAARFGLAGGNIETGGGVATPQVIRTDFFDAMERFGGFQDPELQPAIDPAVIDEGAVVFFNVQNLEVFREAFVQSPTIGSAGAAAGVGNIIFDAGMKVKLVPTQRITDNDWFVFLEGFDLKPIFEQIARPLTETIEVEENSDNARRTKQEGIFWNTIRGFGVNLPLGTVQVNNV